MDCPNQLTLVTLNLMYDPSYDEDHPWHFWQRWDAIQKATRGVDIICLQEAHSSWIETIDEFARVNNYIGNLVQYGGKKRDTYLITMMRPSLIPGNEPVSAAHKVDDQVRGLVTKIMWCDRSITLYNVHIQLAMRNANKRFLATKSVIDAARLDTNAVVVGDWNTIRGKTRLLQLGYAVDHGKLAQWKHFGGGVVVPKTTFYGSPREIDRLKGYSTPVELDQIFIRSQVLCVQKATCKHTFVDNNVAISDHFPCYVTINCA